MCLIPIFMEKLEVQVPCGNCPECRSKRASAWSFRLMQELRYSLNGHFVTLTYDAKNVPRSYYGFKTLLVTDVQAYFKKLRKLQIKEDESCVNESNHGQPIRYYTAGEYGSKTLRPHYHIILFNASAENICKAWDKGGVHLGQVSEASVGYTLKYISKPGRIPIHSRDDRKREFAVMSKGIGKRYLTEAMKAWHLADPENRVYCNLPGGKKIGMPRYYKERVGYTEEQLEQAAYYQVLKLREEEEKLMKQYGDGYAKYKAEYIKNQFKKAETQSTKNDKL